MRHRVSNSKQACYAYFSVKQKKKPNSVSFPVHKNVELIINIILCSLIKVSTLQFKAAGYLFNMIFREIPTEP